MTGQRSRGQALTEFALIAPLFILLLVAIFDVGRGVFAYNSVTNAAREGSRLAIVNQDVAKITLRATSQTAIAETQGPNVTVAYYLPTPARDPEKNAACTAIPGGGMPVGCVAVVTYQTTFQPITPIISTLLFKNGVTLTAKSAETVEYSCPTATVSADRCPKQP
jgi:Flp pilus assembly protein TadG